MLFYKKPKPETAPADLAIRKSSLTDVPSWLIRYTCGTDDIQEFTRAGREVFWMLNLAAQRFGGRPLRKYRHILDFGCGAGRILQNIPFGHQISGCYVNADLISFVEDLFPEFDFYRNDFLPELKYRSETFDLVYSFSVFSHLSEEVEQKWLRELARVGQAGALYLVSVHGDWMIEETLNEERESAQAAGFYYRSVHQRTGSTLDFPIGYEASYHTSEYIRSRWSEHFEILQVLKGDQPSRYLWSNLAFRPTGTIEEFRPMGQDLVVMRKR